jgi:hypothetical protein
MRKSLTGVGLLGAGLLVWAAPAKAQQVVVDSFPNSSSFVTSSSFPTYGTYGLDLSLPPNVRFDFGGSTQKTNQAIAWSSNDAQGNPSSGSLYLSTLMTAGGQAAWTMDIYANGPVQATELDFDLEVNPNSVSDTYGGIGYFAVVERDGNNYNYEDTSVDDGELGANYSPVVTSTGTWYHFSIPLTAGDSDNMPRAVTFVEDGNPGQNGLFGMYIDNVTLDLPEPGSLGLLSAAGLFVARRRRWA